MKSSFKKFCDGGVSKVFSPHKTCKNVLKKLKNIDPSLLGSYKEIIRPSRIPQYRIHGTEYFREITGQAGSNGKGHSKEQALASGLMEFVERYSCLNFLNSKKTVTLATFSEFQNNPYKLRDLYSHFLNEKQVKILSDRQVRHAKIRWYQGYTLKGDPVHLPAQLLKFILQGTNGMASGNSLEEALSHGICEVIERHVKTLLEVKRLKTPFIDISTIDCPIAHKLIDRFQSLGYTVFIKDFSLNLGLPIIGVVRKIKKNECVVTVGVATSRREALVRALTENSQGEGALEENHRNFSSLSYSLSYKKSINWNDIPEIYNKNIRLEIKTLAGLLEQKGMKVFYVNTTDPVLKIPSVLVIIPGAKFLDKRIINRNILFALITEYFTIENYNGIKKLLTMADKIDKKNQSLYFFYRAILARRNHLYKEAIGLFIKHLNAKKNNLSVYEEHHLRTNCLANLGICSLALGKHGDAVDYFTKLIDIEHDFSLVEIKSIYKNINLLSKDASLLNLSEKLLQKIKSMRNSLGKSVNSTGFKPIGKVGYLHSF